MALPGASTVVLGGSRALGQATSASDWDLGVYYQDTIDLTELEKYATVYCPGSWGRIMNGGAWLEYNGYKVDVLLRNLRDVAHWTQCAEQGEYEVDALLGYLAGVPTYSLCAELASCQYLCGERLTGIAFPPQLAAAAPARWRVHRSFSLNYARMHARQGNVVGATGQVAKAVMEEAHALLCERSQWSLNEKRLIEAAGLSRVQSLFAQVPMEPIELIAWIRDIEQELDN